MRVIRFPTTVATIVGRWAVDGEGDMPAVAALQAELTLTPHGAEPAGGLPAPNPPSPRTSRFFEQLRVWMQAFPPAERDLDYQRRFEPLGLFDAGVAVRRSRSELAAAARRASRRARQQLEQR